LLVSLTDSHTTLPNMPVALHSTNYGQLTTHLLPTLCISLIPTASDQRPRVDVEQLLRVNVPSSENSSLVPRLSHK
jgi:hypothetical protein